MFSKILSDFINRLLGKSDKHYPVLNSALFILKFLCMCNASGRGNFGYADNT